LASVIVVITTPDNKTYSGEMIRTRQSGNDFNYIFEGTKKIGTYDFEIHAIDTSYYENNASLYSNFAITKDKTLPKIFYFDARPHIQISGREVEIFCIAEDNIGINKVEVTIIDPDDNRETRPMEWSSLGKFVYSAYFEKIGKFEFFVKVTDEAGNNVEEQSKYLWITEDKDDIDNDGMPNWWEEKYGLDPEDPDDAKKDKDGDGNSNFREFESNTNPGKNNFGENIGVQLKENSLYVIGSVIFFIFLIVLLLIVRWRKMR
jgi:hypothetical protein